MCWYVALFPTQRSTKEYKGRIDSNSPTEPNEAVCLATLLV